MYTIEQLERVIDGWNVAVTRDGDETPEDSAVIETINFMGKLTLARQLLDTMRENAKLRAALEWYADENRYHHGHMEIFSPAEVDDGQRARTALKGDA